MMPAEAHKISVTEQFAEIIPPRTEGLTYGDANRVMHAAGWLSCDDVAQRVNASGVYEYPIEKIHHLFSPMVLLGASIIRRHNGRYPAKRWIYFPAGIFERLVETIRAKRVLDSLAKKGPKGNTRWKFVIEGLGFPILRDEQPHREAGAPREL